MGSSRTMLCVVAMLAGMGAPIRARAFTWQEVGPRGGGATGLAIDANGTTLYAVGDRAGLGGGHGGVHHSEDGGATWSDAALAGNLVAGIAADPSTPGTAYAVTEACDVFLECPTTVFVAVYKTTNGGTSWSQIYTDALSSSTLFVNGFHLGLAVDPNAPGTVHLGAYLRSIDGGATWSYVVGPVPELTAVVAVDPANPQVVYAGGGSGIFKSTDGGNTYVSALANLGPFFPVNAIAIDGGTLYIGGSAAYRSDDAAASWTPTGALPAGITSIAARDGVVWAANAGGAGVFGTVFRSTDGGTTWVERGTGLPRVVGDGNVVSHVNALAVPPGAHSAFAATDNFGVYRTDSDGLDWRPPLNGLRLLEVQDVLIDPAAPATLHAGTTRGFFRTRDAGASWTPLVDGLFALDVRRIARDPQTPSTFYAVIAKENTSGTFGVVKSTDAGATWSLRNTGLGQFAQGINAIAIDPVTPSTVYLGGGSFAKSTNGAASWTVTSPSMWGAQDLVIHPSDPLRLYAVGFEFGFNVSPDGGATWSQSNTGLTDLSLMDLAIDPQNALRLYAVDAGVGVPEVFTSSDGGASWDGTGVVPGRPSVAAVNPVTSAVYVAGEAGVVEGPVGGAAWTPLGTGLAMDRVLQLAVEPDGRALYAGGLKAFQDTGDLQRLQLLSCATAADCDDANACTMDACDGTGTCSNTPVADGAACSDGDVCTTDVCTSGACRSALEACGVCGDSSTCEVVITAAKISRHPTNGSVTAKGTIALGPGGVALSPATGLTLDVRAGGFVATGEWAPSDCKITGARFACQTADRSQRFKLRPVRTGPPRFALKLRRLAIPVVPSAPVRLAITEVGSASGRAGTIADCTAKTSALVCRAL